MSTLSYFRVMARYNRWMNDKLYAVCAGLGDEERKRDRGAFFRSIHGTFNHLLLADRLWLGRFLGRPYAVGSLGEELYADFDELREERAGTDAEILAYTEGLDEAALASDLRFTSVVEPQERVIRLEHALMHFFNHQTHHRGQATTLIQQAHAQPGITDLMWMLLDEAKGGAA